MLPFQRKLGKQSIKSLDQLARNGDLWKGRQYYGLGWIKGGIGNADTWQSVSEKLTGEMCSGSLSTTNETEIECNLVDHVPRTHFTLSLISL